jgi:tetratricopeptide (TPR) repeat protein
LVRSTGPLCSLPDNARAYWVKSLYLSNVHRANEAFGVADAGLAIDPNYAHLYVARNVAEVTLGRFEQAKSDVQQAMSLSPRDPSNGWFHWQLGIAEFGLGHFDAAIDEYNKSIDLGLRLFWPYAGLAVTYALVDKMDEAKSALAEGRRLNPKLTIKWATPIVPPPLLAKSLEGMHKVGMPEE